MGAIPSIDVCKHAIHAAARRTDGLAGEWEEALYEVTEAPAYADACGNRFWNGQLLQQQGDYRQGLSHSAGEVEAQYQRGIVVSQQQGARMLELRVTTSLCRLLMRHGRLQEARERIERIYAGFTEGFGTADVQEAKALIAELQSARQN